MPGDTPKECPSCKSDRVDVRCCLNVVNQSADGHVPYGDACVPCVDVWHAAPLAFDAALAALDVEENLHPDRMEVTHTILGLDAVRAAHRAEVERAIAALSARVAKLEAALRFYADDANYRFQNDADGSLRSPAVNEDHGAEARAALEDKP